MSSPPKRETTAVHPIRFRRVDLSILRAAAEATHQSLTQFIRSAALRAAVAAGVVPTENLSLEERVQRLETTAQRHEDTLTRLLTLPR